MGQQEVLDYLKKARDWKTNKQISEKIKVGKSCTIVTTERLYKQGLVFRKELKGRTYIYKFRKE